MQYDGVFFDLKWKSVKVDRPKVMCICDVSGSVSNYSRFLLMFLYSLAEIIPKVRSFAFSSDLGEVTQLFQNSNLEDAMAKTMRDYGNGSTDYGQMLLDFKRTCMDDVDNKTTTQHLSSGSQQRAGCTLSARRRCRRGEGDTYDAAVSNIVRF